MVANIIPLSDPHIYLFVNTVAKRQAQGRDVHVQQAAVTRGPNWCSQDGFSMSTSDLIALGTLVVAIVGMVGATARFAYRAARERRGVTISAAAVDTVRSL